MSSSTAASTGGQTHTGTGSTTGRILTYAGAILAFLIGSGFATGQEIFQYFTAYGRWGVFGSGLLVMVLFVFIMVELFTTGQRERFERPGKIFHYYGGRALGTFFDYFTIVFIFLIFTVMIAGAAATANEQYGVSPWVGGVGMTLLVIVTAWFGLNRLVDIIGKIGPLIVIVAIILGIVGIIQNPGGIKESDTLLPTLEVKAAASNWFMAGFSYVGYNMLATVPFLAALGKTAKVRKEAVWGGALGGFFFAATCIVVGLGLLANLAQTWDAQIPMLVLARQLSPAIAAIISVMILAGIYTTAVPMLWTVSSRFTTDGTGSFKITTIVLAIVGMFIGMSFDFSTLVNIVYQLNGYVGMLLLALMIIRVIVRLVRREHLKHQAS
ncbi:hypothetical protein NQ036_06160 [Brevibacterium sp. 91QC2O2]|uniref:YkvI family membrane protein n=1 Tax=Brevibacterium sp. 91QC2O2 TaxID=2968458 RepID=UPI00211BD65B|nr:hypothetical protein [Brevibacterium sp. 91QC2O2]MCQ9367832.1 hypothetical protein [Brevibacterium sp. 91QC2O2]